MRFIVINTDDRQYLRLEAWQNMTVRTVMFDLVTDTENAVSRGLSWTTQRHTTGRWFGRVAGMSVEMLP